MTYKFRKFHFKEYTRTSKYLKVDEFIRINDPDGFVAFMKIAYAEVMGHLPILFADEFDGINAKGARAGVGQPVVAPVPSGPFVGMDFLNPSRVDSLIQARPSVFALYRSGANAGQLAPMTPEMAEVWVQWVHPLQTNRGGTDIETDVIMNINSRNGGIPQRAGGRLGGVVNALDIYTRDDPNENVDVFVMYGTVPGYRILNNHATFPIGGGLTPNEDLDFDWYLAFQGYRYVIEPVTTEEFKQLEDYELPFIPVSVGGVPTVSTIRAGGV